MAERKTGVMPLNYLTEADRELFTDSEIVELMIKTFTYLRTGEEPTFSKRLMKVRFMDHKEFFDRNRATWQKRAESSNLTQNRNRPKSTETEPKSTEIGYVNVNVNENVFKRKINKKKSLSNIIEHDYSGIEIKDQRRTMK